MIIVLFGLPGTGKNFVAEILKDNFGFYLYDADKSLPLAAFRAIKKKHLVTKTTRRAFYKKLAKKTKWLEKKYSTVVVPRTFTHNSSRRYFKKLLPKAQFVLVEASRKIRYRRIIRRNHHIDLEYAKKIEGVFEKPDVLYSVLKNNDRGKTSLKRRIARILKKANRT